MIPYAILSGQILWKEAAPTDIRVLDLSPDGFTFRLSHRQPKIKEMLSISLSFFVFEKNIHENVILNINSGIEYRNQSTSFEHEKNTCILYTSEDDNSIYTDFSTNQYSTRTSSRSECQSFSDHNTKKDFDCSLTFLEEHKFYRLYRVETQNPDFLRCTRKLMQEYTSYIHLKIEESDSILSQELAGYPAEKDDIFPASPAAWKAEMLQAVHEKFDEQPELYLRWEKLLTHLELALELDSPVLIQHFLEQPCSSFSQMYWKENHLDWHPLSHLPVTTVYLGSQYCRFRFPSLPNLNRVIQHSLEQNIHPVICFPPIRQQDLPWMKACLRELAPISDAAHQPLEIVLNDYGMAHFIKQTYPDTFLLTLGVLLNKRKKDVRLNYKKGLDTQLQYLRENALRAAFVQDTLAEAFDIHSYSLEACGYLYSVPEGRHTLHLPLYQMNTSGHCTRYACSANGNRSRQTSVSACPGYCRKDAFLYPSHLHMIGYQNSLFGFDQEILWNPEYFQQLINPSVRRIVFSFVSDFPV